MKLNRVTSYMTLRYEFVDGKEKYLADVVKHTEGYWYVKVIPCCTELKPVTYEVVDGTIVGEGVKAPCPDTVECVEWYVNRVRREPSKAYPTKPAVFDGDGDEAETEVKSDVSFFADGKPVTVKQVANGHVDRLEAGKCKYMVVPVVGPEGKPLCKQEILSWAQNVLLRQFKGEYFNPDDCGKECCGDSEEANVSAFMDHGGCDSEGGEF